MTRTYLSLLAVLLGFVAAAAVGCKSGDKLVSKCQSDADCGDPAKWRCSTATGECLCRNDAACPQDETCNPEGYCQKHYGCFDNRDCPKDFFCDAMSLTCVPIGRCATDLDCPVEKGELCDR